MLKTLIVVYRVLTFVKWWFSVLLLLLALVVFRAWASGWQEPDTGRRGPSGKVCNLVRQVQSIAADLCDKIDKWVSHRDEPASSTSPLGTPSGAATTPPTSATATAPPAPATQRGSRTYRASGPLLSIPLSRPAAAVLTTVAGKCVWSLTSAPVGYTVLPGADEVVQLKPDLGGTLNLHIRNTTSHLSQCLITVVDQTGVPRATARSPREAGPTATPSLRPTRTAGTPPSAGAAPATPHHSPTDEGSALVPCLADTGLPIIDRLQECADAD